MLPSSFVAPPRPSSAGPPAPSVPIVEWGEQRVDGAAGLTVEASRDQASIGDSTADPDDVALRRAFREGDADALGRVFDLFARPAWSVAMSVVRDRQLADEATQEAFLRAWRAAGRFDPQRSLAPWLMTITRRTALDVLRRENRPTRGDHEPEQDLTVNLPGIERAWETWEVKSALERLPVEEREVVWFAHYHGMSHPQIAGQLDIPVGTVKSRSHRAHKRLASLLSHVFNQGEVS